MIAIILFFATIFVGTVVVAAQSKNLIKVRNGLGIDRVLLVTVIRPTRRLAVASDPDDDIFLECADQARADYLITGNRKHFPASWRGTKIISEREFIALAAPHLHGEIQKAF